MQIVRPLGLTDADYTVNITENDAAAYNGGTPYAEGDQVVDSHGVYVSTISSNTGNTPSDENQSLTSKKWQLISKTNAYRFADGILSNKTTNGSTTVVIDVANAEGAEAILFFGMKASAVQVEAFDSGAVSVYDETSSLSGREVYTFYDWFTKPIGQAKIKLFIDDLPTDTDSLKITVSGTDIEIGEIVIGELFPIGTALMNGTGGRVKSYTRIQENAYGFREAILGPTANIMTYRVHTVGAAFPTVKDFLDRLAGTVVGAVGSETRPSTIQLGYLGTIQWDENLPSDYIYDLKLDGVI